MSADKIPITERGYEALQEELRQLKTVARHEIIQAIAEARKHGDLSENAEYHTARERQGFIEGRIAELEDRISRVNVIDIKKLSGTRIMFGATVYICDEDTEEEIYYQIVGEDEADLKEFRISILSPLARALIGKTIGDNVEVSTPKGLRCYEIIRVIFS